MWKTKPFIKKLIISLTAIFLSFVCLYFLVLRSWYRPMTFDVSSFDNFAKTIDEYDSLDLLYEDLNSTIVFEEYECYSDLDFENGVIDISYDSDDLNAPVFPIIGGIKEKNSSREFFFPHGYDARNFDDIYNGVKNSYAPWDPFYGLLVYNYENEKVSVQVTPLTKGREVVVFGGLFTLSCIYITTEKYEIYLGIEFEKGNPQNAEKQIESALEQLIR